MLGIKGARVRRLTVLDGFYINEDKVDASCE